MTEIGLLKLFNELLNHGTKKQRTELWRLIRTNDNNLVREYLEKEFEKRQKD